jgi:hypothetical protein
MQRAPDAAVVARARSDSSVILTFDLDFGEILALGVLDRMRARSTAWLIVWMAGASSPILA